MITFQKVWFLLTFHQRRAAFALFGFMFIGMLLETLGVGVILPALALMVNQELLTSYPVLSSAIETLGNPTQEQLVAGGLLVLMGIYTLKALFLIFLIMQQSRFVADLQASISQRLFDGYLYQPWTFHLERNSAQLIRNAINEVQQFSSAAASALVILTESLILTGICALLFVVEPTASILVVSVFGSVAWGYQRLSSGYLLKWGKGRHFHDGQRIQHIQQGLGGVKDIKLLGRELEFSNRYRDHNLRSAYFFRRNQTLQQLPRLLFELLAVGGMVTIGLVMISTGKSATELLPTLGLFAAAAFRLLPSVNRIVNALQSIRFTLPVINTLYQEMQEMKPPAVQAQSSVFPLRNEIKLSNVSYRYPNSHKSALNKVSLVIPRGSSVGFIGGSGAGKSTLVDTILGLLTPDTGQILVDGIDIQKNLHNWQTQIGYVPQTIFLTDDSLRRNIAFGIEEDCIDERSVERAIKAVQLKDFVASLPGGLDTLVGERGVRLSGGQRQRVGVARALYHDPDVLVLDEATSALDTLTEQDVMEAIRSLEENKTIMIVAHRLSTIKHCDMLYRVEGGRVVAEGTYTELCPPDSDKHATVEAGGNLMANNDNA